MPFVLIIIGAVLFVSAIQGTTGQLGTLVKGDITGQGSFIYWFIAILIIGAIGYIPSLKKLSDAFLVLLLLVLFIANKGVFAQFNSAIKQVTAGTSTAATISGLSTSMVSTLSPAAGNL
jgi:hypothetical protein